MHFRAVFLDRDGTLSQSDPVACAERDEVVGRIIGRPDFAVTYESRMEVFWRVMDEPGMGPVNTLEREDAFWRRWYQVILEDHGITRGSDEIAAGLHERFAHHRMMIPYPETVGVLEALCSRGLRLGVISDTFPSLEASLASMDIAVYFESFTASSVVGAMKPDPRIFEAALSSLGVTAAESVFVDDCLEEADGAREQGFCAFHLDRARPGPCFASWRLSDLDQLVAFLDQ
jgi:putative hydrolase of the HAD superfamily